MIYPGTLLRKWLDGWESGKGFVEVKNQTKGFDTLHPKKVLPSPGITDATDMQNIASDRGKNMS